ncbi:CDP-6-deoxy-L-threo-D-glycero-4-hexulose-3-dehydrase reductase [mine drainage metagenome]|uniref:CDP-6-deoxy-L-threo-D-glycero-4-hexulose-3-dehydrase reductase n=1 Tax=mine drainage metagenome TaxID=410659 RepID=A0A1J5SQE5_9ZZZZ
MLADGSGSGSDGGESVGQHLTLSRAAQLIGVSRGALQRKIREGELPSHDGMVAAADLLRAYPDFNLEDSGALERVLKIKEEAFGRRVMERVLPSSEVLAQRLFAQSQELGDLRRHLARYHELVLALQVRVAQTKAQAQTPGSTAQAWLELGEMLERGLAEVLASSEPPDALGLMDDMLKVMSAHVTVRPSGRQFLVEGHDTLLKAGLGAGLTLNYGCGNGNCGLCKARVVSGEVRRVQHCDYALSEAERLQGYVLLCAHTAVSDVVLEALEARGPADIPEQRIVARVRSVAPVNAHAADTLLLHVQTPRSNRLRFLAGQSVTLGLAGDGDDCSATYPVASCPCDDRNLHFHVARPAAGDADPFAERLFSGALKAGQELSLWGPWEEFTLAADSGRPLIFAACDTGFAPINSLIEHALAVDAAESLALYWLATRADGHYRDNQCRAWADALDHFRYAPLRARDAGDGGRDTARAIAAGCAGALARHDVYLSGPQAFVAAAAAELEAAGLAASQLHARVI